MCSIFSLVGGRNLVIGEVTPHRLPTTTTIVTQYCGCTNFLRILGHRKGRVQNLNSNPDIVAADDGKRGTSGGGWWHRSRAACGCGGNGWWQLAAAGEGGKGGGSSGGGIILMRCVVVFVCVFFFSCWWEESGYWRGHATSLSLHDIVVVLISYVH